MAYDECGSWTQPCAHSTIELATNQLDYWVGERAVPRDRTVLGIPFYGYVWDSQGGASINYATILQRRPDAWQTDWITDGSVTYSYNGEQTIRDKTALGARYGGVMVWEVAADASGIRSLLRVLNEAM
jgi:chitinase